ncbi:MAG: hypothetical protein WC519_02780 [Parcubacteria group bacterium]
MNRLTVPSGLIAPDDILVETEADQHYDIRPEGIKREYCYRFGQSAETVKRLLAFFREKGLWTGITVSERKNLICEKDLDPDAAFSRLICRIDDNGPPFTFLHILPCYIVIDALGTLYVTKFFIGLLAAEDYVFKERKIRTKNRPRGEVCTPGDECCWECGFIAPVEVFWGRNRCPNPDCPHPKRWND